MGNNATNTQFKLEEAMAELEQINRQLEGGQVSLQDSIELYKRGKKIASECDAYLKSVDREIQKIDGEGNIESVDTSGWSSSDSVNNDSTATE